MDQHASGHKPLGEVLPTWIVRLAKQRNDAARQYAGGSGLEAGEQHDAATVEEGDHP